MEVVHSGFLVPNSLPGKWIISFFIS